VGAAGTWVERPPIPVLRSRSVNGERVPQNEANPLRQTSPTDLQQRREDAVPRTGVPEGSRFRLNVPIQISPQRPWQALSLFSRRTALLCVSL
jgi:hypothetical protein